MSIAAPISASTWVGGRSVADPCPSPDGQTVAFVVTNGTEVHLAVMPSEGGAETWLPCEPAVKRSGGVLDWLPDGEAIAYIGSDGRVHTIDLNTYQCRTITSLGQPLASLSVSPDGTRVAYVIDNAEVMVAFLTQPGRQPMRLSSGADFVFDPCWSPDSRLVAWHEWDAPNMPWDNSRICWRPADLSDAITTIFSSPDASVAQPCFSPDGKQLAFLCDSDGFLNVWAVATDAPHAAKPLISDTVEHGGPSWGPAARTYAWAADSTSIFFSRNIAGWGSLWACDLASGDRRHVDDGFYTAVRRAGDDVIGIRRSSENGSTLVRAALDGSTRILMRTTVDGLGAGVEPRLVQWNSADGSLISGRLYQPDEPDEPGAGPPPLLVWAHGGPHGQSPVTAYGRFGYFVQRGWAVLNVDYRGTNGWGRVFSQSLNGHWGEYDVQDVTSAIRVAHEQGWGDARRTAVFGSSAGGFTSLLVAATEPGLVQAVAAISPVSDLLAFDEDTWRFEAHYAERLVGPMPEAGEILRQRSPITVAAQIKTPVLILHGENDDVVPAEHSEALAEAIAAGGGSVERHVYPEEGHGWRNANTQADELERIEAFLNRHVLGEPAAKEGTQ